MKIGRQGPIEGPAAGITITGQKLGIDDGITRSV